MNLLILLVLMVAALLHGLTGLGFPLIGTAALSTTMPLPKAVALMAIPSLLMSLLVLITAKSQGLPNIWQDLLADKHLIIASIIGGLLGIGLLVWLPVAWLSLLMAVITFSYVIYAHLSDKGKLPSIRLHHATKTGWCFGILAGLIGGATNAMSPILMVYLFATTTDKLKIIVISNVCYLLSKLIQITGLRGEFSQFTASDWKMLFAISVVSMAGLMVGIKLRIYVKPPLFKGLIYMILLVLSIKIGYSGLSSLTDLS